MLSIDLGRAAADFFGHRFDTSGLVAVDINQASNNNGGDPDPLFHNPELYCKTALKGHWGRQGDLYRSPSASSSEILTGEITREITDGMQGRRKVTIMQPYLIVWVVSPYFPLQPKRQPQAQIPQLPNPEFEKFSDRLSRRPLPLAFVEGSCESFLAFCTAGRRPAI